MGMVAVTHHLLRCDHRNPPYPGSVRQIRCLETFGVGENYQQHELADLINDARRLGWEISGTERFIESIRSRCPHHSTLEASIGNCSNPTADPEAS